MEMVRSLSQVLVRTEVASFTRSMGDRGFQMAVRSSWTVLASSLFHEVLVFTFATLLGSDSPSSSAHIAFRTVLTTSVAVAR